MALKDAKDATLILAGGAEVKIGAWVTAGGAGSLKTFGHTLAPAELGMAFEDFEIETEQSVGRVKSIPVSAQYTIKCDVAQNETDAMLIAMRMASAQLTGTGNINLAIVDPSEIYYQVALVGKGYGTTASTDTYTFWRCQVGTVDNIPFGKRAVQHLGITFKILRDDSVTATTTKGLYGVRVVG